MSMNLGAASPSIGSRLHGSDCKPCAWFWKKGGCLNGVDCRHCHSCTYGELSRRKSENRRRNRRRGMIHPRELSERKLPPQPGAVNQQFHINCLEGQRELAIPETAGECELPSSQHHGFQRSVTLPAVRPEGGGPMLKNLPVPCIDAVAGLSSITTLEVEPWELPSPQHCGFHRAMTEPASLEGRPLSFGVGSQAALPDLSEGTSLPAMMIVVPVTAVAMVPLVINRMQA